MNPVYQEIALIVMGNIISGCVTMYLIRWRKRENRPRELELEIDRLAKSIVTLRGQVKYIEGKINGAAWRPGGISGK